MVIFWSDLGLINRALVSFWSIQIALVCLGYFEHFKMKH